MIISMKLKFTVIVIILLSFRKFNKNWFSFVERRRLKQGRVNSIFGGTAEKI